MTEIFDFISNKKKKFDFCKYSFHAVKNGFWFHVTVASIRHIIISNFEQLYTYFLHNGISIYENQELFYLTLSQVFQSFNRRCNHGKILLNNFET